MSYSIKKISSVKEIKPYIKQIDEMMSECFEIHHKSSNPETSIIVNSSNIYYLAFNDKNLIGFCSLSYDPPYMFYFPEKQVKNFEHMKVDQIKKNSHLMAIYPMIYSLCKKKNSNYKGVGKFLIDEILKDNTYVPFIYLSPRSSTDNEKLLKYYIRQLDFKILKNFSDVWYIKDNIFEILPILYKKNI